MMMCVTSEVCIIYNLGYRGRFIEYIEIDILILRAAPLVTVGGDWGAGARCERQGAAFLIQIQHSRHHMPNRGSSAQDDALVNTLRHTCTISQLPLSLLANACSRRLIALDCSRARRASSRRARSRRPTVCSNLAATSAVMLAATSAATSLVEHSSLRCSSVCHSCGPPSSASWVVSHPWASLHPWALVRACTSQLAGRTTAPCRAPPRRRPRRLR